MCEPSCGPDVNFPVSFSDSPLIGVIKKPHLAAFLTLFYFHFLSIRVTRWSLVYWAAGAAQAEEGDWWEVH